MIPVAKHGDPQIGVDIHLCVVPPSPSPVPLPTPHTSIVFDPMDYVPFFGATVTVCGMKRAVAGTAGQAIHIPPGFPFAPKLPDKDDEIFMGSATVVADGDPLSFLGVPVLACQVAGMPSPPRPKRKGGPRVMTLPTVTNLAIPTNVFVGGPPTISLMGMLFKLGFAGLGKLGKTKFAQGLAERFRDWRKAKFGHLNPGFLKCSILRAEPVNIVTGAVTVEQLDFELPGLIPIRWTRRYASDNPRRGVLGHGWECPADARLEHDRESGVTLFRHPEGGIAVFPSLPAAEGEEAAVLELMDGAELSDHGAEFRVRTKEDRVYGFPKTLRRDAADGEREYPLGWIGDLCGNSLIYERSAAGRLVAIRESAGRVIRVEGEEGGPVERVALEVPESGFRHVYAAYEQDAAGDLVAVRDALGSPYRFAYEAHRMLRHTDRNGLSFHYEYDSSGREPRVVRSWGDGGLYAYSFAYLDAVNERRITDSLGHVSLVTLDGRGLPIRELDALGGVTIYEYDEAGRTTAVVDQDGHRTEYAFDERGNLTKLTRADGTAVNAAYQSLGKLVSISEPGGATWAQTWDHQGRVATRRSPMGRVEEFRHDSRGLLVGAGVPAGPQRRLAHDSFGNLVLAVDESGATWHHKYDPLGNLVESVDPIGRRTLLSRDRKGQLKGMRFASGHAIRYAHDPEGNVTSSVDQLGATTHIEYFGQGEIALEVRADGSRIHYLYDTEERLVAVVNAHGRKQTLERDALGRVVRETDYWGGTTVYTYSAAGRPLETVNPDGRWLKYELDGVGRLLRRTQQDPDGGGRLFEEMFEYDASDRIVACENPHIRIERNYDLEGRLLEERQGEALTVGYAWNEAGNRATRRITRGGKSARVDRELEYAYDAAGRVTGLSARSQPPIRIERDPAGRITREWMEGLTQSSTYSPDDRLLQRRSQAKEGSLTVRYRYDEVGNLLERDEGRGLVDRFTYNAVEQVTGHTGRHGGSAVIWNDPAEGRLRTEIRLSATPEEGGGTQPWTRTGSYEGTDYRFGVAGTLVSRATGDDRIAFRWDADHRLTESCRAGLATRYQYDPLGRRIAKITGGRTTRFAWDGDVLAAEWTEGEGSGDLTEWIQQPGDPEPVAMLPGDDGSARLRLFQTDPNGAPIRLLDMEGRVEWSARYGPLGFADQQGSLLNPIRLQGQYEDEETGLHYNRNRYFDPHIGAFISQDPIGLLGGENRYRYAPNIWSYIDPLGLRCDPKKATHITYVGVDALTGKPYIGYASMPGKQIGEDVLNYRYSSGFDRFAEPPTVVFEGFGQKAKETARGLEQRFFEQAGGLGSTANRQNPVGARNANRTKYLNAADKWLSG
ncbi:RHS repeat-associated core domain-containing protein [Pararoseomonas sp. SCSIO 73927]|uniref:RHS repeat-associated core domain-containing protein n=1 Tax=Pararoseomonas sp. SCSIO 73927 TaxID=3114537 RepID=UPI0030D08498